VSQVSVIHVGMRRTGQDVVPCVSLFSFDTDSTGSRGRTLGDGRSM
jgi:hypothetical protein